MKNLLLGLALVAGSAFTAHANATVPSVAYACHLQAQVVEDNGFYFVFRIEDVKAVGTISCIDQFGRVLNQEAVNVEIKGGGIGLGAGIPGTLTGLNVFAVKAGIAHPSAMYGAYSLQAGPGLSLVGVRAAANAGVEITPGAGVAAKIEVTIEQRVGIGLDFSASTMTITPVKAKKNRKG